MWSKRWLPVLLTTMLPSGRHAQLLALSSWSMKCVACSRIRIFVASSACLAARRASGEELDGEERPPARRPSGDEPGELGEWRPAGLLRPGEDGDGGRRICGEPPVADGEVGLDISSLGVEESTTDRGRVRVDDRGGFTFSPQPRRVWRLMVLDTTLIDCITRQTIFCNGDLSHGPPG